MDYWVAEPYEISSIATWKKVASINRTMQDFHYTFYQRPIIEMKLPGKYLPVCGQLESNMPQDRYQQTQ